MQKSATAHMSRQTSSGISTLGKNIVVQTVEFGKQEFLGTNKGHGPSSQGYILN